MGLLCILYVALVVLLLGKVDGAKEEWTYDNEDTGPEQWSSLPGYEACGGDQQSPINIISSTATDSVLGSFTLVGFGANDIPTGATWEAVNNGHAVEVELTGDYLVSGGGLTSETSYKSIQFHFHWGSLSTEGSEHLIDGKQYAGEMHIVSYNTKFSDITTAVGSGERDALAVLGFVIEEQSDDNEAFDELFEVFSKLRYDGDEYEIEAPVPFSTLLPSDLESYYRYMGSLTTPSCNQVVAWTVFKKPITLSGDQLNVFRGQFTNKDGADENITLAYNFRPAQSIGGRTVYNNVESSAPGLYATTASIVSMVIIKMLGSALTE